MEVQSDPKEEIYLNESNDNADFGQQTKGPVPGCWERTFPTGYLAGLKNIINLVWGLILVQFCQIALQPATIIFAGHLGKIELDTVALSITLMNITGYSVVIGMATACDTLFSQTYGSKNKKLVGIQVQRSLLIHFIALCICWALHLNIEGILRILGQDHEVSRLVGQYMLLFMPGMLCMFAYTILRKWVQCQNIVNPMIVVSAIGLGINIFLQWYLMYFKEWGLLGSVLALDITYILLLAMTMLYILISGVYKETWDGWDWRMFEDWGEFSRLALFGLLMTCLEWWAFEVTVLLAGTIGTTELGAQSLIFSVDGLIIGIPSGIAVAVTIRVGQSLGAGKPLEAMTTARIGFTIGALLTVIISICLGVFRKEIPALLTNVEEVIDLVATILPIVAFYCIMDATTFIARGIMRGCGKQGAATVIILVGFYVFGLPIGISLLYLTDLKTIGLWIGLATGVTIATIIYVIYINTRFDWDELSKEARKRARIPSIHVFENGAQDEETPLLNSSKSNPIDVIDKEDKMTPENRKPDTVSRMLIFSRMLIILGSVGFLLGGVLCKLFIFIPTDWSIVTDSNSTLNHNLTLLQVFKVDT